MLSHKDIPKDNFTVAIIYDGSYYFVYDEDEITYAIDKDRSTAVEYFYHSLDETLSRWQTSPWIRDPALKRINRLFKKWGWPPRPERII